MADLTTRGSGLNLSSPERVETIAGFLHKYGFECTADLVGMSLFTFRKQVQADTTCVLTDEECASLDKLVAQKL